MLWRVEGTAVHMVGSAHYLTASDYPLPVALDAAYQSANLLVLEADVGALRGISLGRFSDGRVLADVAQNDYAEILAAFQNCKVPGPDFAQTEPWLLAFQLISTLLNQRGYEHALGLDTHFRSRAEVDKKRLVFLEEPRTALLCFQAGGYSTQLERLLFLIRNTEYAVDLTVRTLRAWRACDMDELKRIYEEQVARFPGMQSCLIDARNQDWMRPLRWAITLGKPALVCVGAMHFVGKNALPSLLGAAGFSVVPVSYSGA
jgi:uncharacterized protein YbaP (TraB family)